jgi:hypothetical protein
MGVFVRWYKFNRTIEYFYDKFSLVAVIMSAFVLKLITRNINNYSCTTSALGIIRVEC